MVEQLNPCNSTQAKGNSSKCERQNVSQTFHNNTSTCVTHSALKLLIDLHHAHGVGEARARLPASDDDHEIFGLEELACFADFNGELHSTVNVVGPVGKHRFLQKTFFVGFTIAMLPNWPVELVHCQTPS